LRPSNKHLPRRGQVNAPRSAAAASEMNVDRCCGQSLKHNVRETRSIQLKNVMDQITTSH
jgi:hypothetical protein